MLKCKAVLCPQLSVIPIVCLVCAIPLNCEETMTPWCEAKLMSSEHWGDPRRSYHRREFVMVNCCLIAEHIGLRSSGCQDGRRGGYCCRLVAGRISRRQDFLAKVSKTVTQCSMCVYLLCWQLPGAQITACHIRSFCLSCPALKDSFTLRDYYNQQQFGGLEA